MLTTLAFKRLLKSYMEHGAFSQLKRIISEWDQ